MGIKVFFVSPLIVRMVWDFASLHAHRKKKELCFLLNFNQSVVVILIIAAKDSLFQSLGMFDRSVEAV